MLADYAMLGSADLSRAAFTRVLQEAQSPALAEAGTMYDALVAASVRPAPFLAFFKVESRCGLVGICKEFDTRNPGNVRTPELDNTATAIVDTPRGRFARYPDWTTGTRDWAARMLGPKYAGRGLRTVRQVLPVYAPAADGNAPEAYIKAVLTSVENWLKEGGMVQLTGRTDLLPANAVNNPNRLMWDGKPRSITIHETDNHNAGANAEMHRRWVHNGGGDDSASFHAVVDDRESIQLLPWNAAAFHVGDGGGEGNSTSIGIEICVNQGGNYLTSVDRAARLTAALLQQFGLGIENVRQHGSWWSSQNPHIHKGCPAHLKSGKQPNGQPGPTWADFVALVKEKLGEGPHNRSDKLKGAFAALPRWLVGNAQFEAQIDLSELQLPNNVQGLICEKSVIWTDGARIDAFHRGQYEEFKSRGKAQEFRQRDAGSLLKAGDEPTPPRYYPGNSANGQRRRSRGIALNIGLNRVDPRHYGGWDGQLIACEADARAMYGLARQAGFEAQTLLTSEASSREVIAAIGDAAVRLDAGDILLLTYSGHGAQIPDSNGDESDGLDETWALYDRQLLDDELYGLWATFRPGVRIVMLSDSCHSGSMSRQAAYENIRAAEGATWATRSATGLPAISAPPIRSLADELQRETYRQNQELYDGLLRANPQGDGIAIGASILLISGCQDNQLSLDGDENGLFTGTLLKVWAEGAFAGDYRLFHRQIQRQMPPWQSPNLYTVGAANPTFEGQKPFTI